MKRARVDEAGTSCPTDEDALSLAPVSGPIPVESPPRPDPVLEVVHPESEEVAPALPPPSIERVVVSSGGDSQDAWAPSRQVSSGGPPEARGQPLRSSGSPRSQESPSVSVRGTTEMVKVQPLS